MAAMARNVLASCLHLGWLLVLTGTAADLVITKTIEQSCIVDTNQGRLDLSSVAKTDGQSTAFSAYGGQPGAPNYAWNPCQDTQPPSCNLAGEFFRQSYTYCFEIEAKVDSKFRVSGDNLYLDYRSTSIKLICAPQTPSNPFQIEQDCETDPTTTCLSLTHTVACLKSATTEPPTSGGGKPLSPGSILLIVAALITLLYFASGMLFMKFVRKAEGCAICPNSEFWSALPSLVKDGVLFPLRGCKAQSAGYNSI